MNSLTSWQLAHAAGLAELAAPDRSSRAAPYDPHRPTRLDAPAWRSGPAFGALLPTAASADSASATSRARPDARPWYISEALGVLCPRRSITSVTLPTRAAWVPAK